MTQAEKQQRDKQILLYVETNPMNARKSEIVEKLARRYKMSTVHIYRILKNANYENN